MRQQISNLILAGIPKEQIITTVGCSEEYLNELLLDKEFVEEVRAQKADAIETDIENKYARLEKATLEKITGQLDYYDAAALCKILETTSRNRVARRPLAQAQQNGHFTNPTLGISVTVPVFLGNSQVILDSNQQVVAIDGRNMAPMPTQQVHALFDKLEKERVRPPNDSEILEGIEGTEAEARVEEPRRAVAA